MDEDSGKPVKVRTRRGHKHKSKKTPPLSPEGTLRILSRESLDDEKEAPTQIIEQHRRFPDDESADKEDSKLDPRESKAEIHADTDSEYCALTTSVLLSR